jgi:hypothetical protein
MLWSTAATANFRGETGRRKRMSYNTVIPHCQCMSVWYDVISPRNASIVVSHWHAKPTSQINWIKPLSLTSPALASLGLFLLPSRSIHPRSASHAHARAHLAWPEWSSPHSALSHAIYSLAFLFFLVYFSLLPIRIFFFFETTFFFNNQSCLTLDNSFRPEYVLLSTRPSSDTFQHSISRPLSPTIIPHHHSQLSNQAQRPRKLYLTDQTLKHNTIHYIEIRSYLYPVYISYIYGSIAAC